MLTIVFTGGISSYNHGDSTGRGHDFLYFHWVPAIWYGARLFYTRILTRFKCRCIYYVLRRDDLYSRFQASKLSKTQNTYSGSGDHDVYYRTVGELFSASSYSDSTHFEVKCSQECYYRNSSSTNWVHPLRWSAWRCY